MLRRLGTRSLAVAASASITLPSSLVSSGYSGSYAAPAPIACASLTMVTPMRRYATKDEGGSKKKDKAAKKDKKGEEKEGAEEKDAAKDAGEKKEDGADAKKDDAKKDDTKAEGEKKASTDGEKKPAEDTGGITAIRDMKPRELMGELDKFIVGQKDAKRAVAVALRNRWRRHQVEPELREEITPKNILMIGPTGVGKTEISRRLAKLTDAPFSKVEATKFTEVGFHGRDVDSIIEDLYKTALSQTKTVLMKRNEEEAKKRAEDRILQALAGAASGFREHLRDGGLDNIDVTLDLLEKKDAGNKSAGMPEGFAQMNMTMMGISGQRRTVKKTLRIKEAMPLVLAEEQEKLVETADVQKEALRACEEDGIVVIDEIDKIVTPSTGFKGHQASAEGVQQDLLPLIEGTTVTTKSGVQVKTDKILFICSGAFHSVKPSDMLAELQGRLPIRVELKALTKEDFHRILTEPKYNLLKQHVAMMATEGVTLKITDDAVWQLASVAVEVNASLQNIGARRLITVTEKVLEEISFEGPERKGETIVVDKEYVDKAVSPMLKKEDLKKYLL